VRGATRRALELAGRYVKLDSEHVWLEIDLAADFPRCELDDGLELVRGDERHLPLLAELPTMGFRAARRRLAEGGRLWLVLEQGRPAFAAWTLEGETPVFAAPGGRVKLPDGVVSLEDSVTSPAFRGRRVAPGAWSAMAQHLNDRGADSLVTTVEAENAAVRRALAKCGFRELCHVRARRRGPLMRVEVSEPLVEDEGGRARAAFIAAHLRR
jgi:ribosomal protein S18 acetylase RimI-like enzyme